MPIWEVERNGKVYEIEAPTPKAAAAAFNPVEAQGYTDPESVKIGPPPPAWHEPGGDVVLDNLRAGIGVVKGAGKELIAQGMRGGAKLRQIPGVDAVANALPSIPVGNMEPQGGAERAGQALLNIIEFLRAGQLTKALPGSVAGRATAGAGINAGIAQAQGQGPVGTAISAAGGALVPGAETIPRSARAARKFDDVMGAAKDVPIDVEGPGKAALRIHELSESGGSMPMAVRKFLNRITNPNKEILPYHEARDFYSNISRLSAAEQQRLTPVMKRAVGELRAALDAANEGAAGEVGKAELYRAAMKEYRRAALLKEGAKKGAKYAAGTAGAGAAYKVLGPD